MYRHEKTLCRDHGRFARYEKESPSFSSSLLEKIYRSIDDDGDKSAGEMRFFRETMAKKQSNSRGTRGIGKKPDEEEEELEDEEETAIFRRACLIEKWMDRKIGETAVAAHRRRQYRHYSESERKYNDSNDALFFSSTSSSSDSSSGGFSSSDTESMFGAARPRPVRIPAAAPEKKPSEPRARNGSCYRPHGDDYDDEALIKSKSRALKIYDNLKKVKQPISPGGKLASFINSLFAGTGGGAKKTTAVAKAASSPAAPSFREAPPSSVSACSSASSFSRSCLSKSSPSTRERLRSFAGEPKRSVRFYPVSVIVDEYSRPCGHKSLREDRALPVSVPTEWKIGRSPAVKGGESELRIPGREFLRDYRQNQMKNELMIMRDQFRTKNDVVQSNKDVVEQEDYENDDDSASCSSSDLFELDHLSVRYQEELPVYETTRVDRNRAIF